MSSKEADGETLSFGDLCEAQFLHDAYVDLDTTRLQHKMVDNKFVEREYGVRPVETYLAVVPDNDRLQQAKDKNHVVAHANLQGRAVCLSDDCEIESRLGRGDRKPQGRLFFAPVTDLNEEERPNFTELNWGRMLTDGDQVVELRRAFGVSATAIAKALEAEDLVAKPLPGPDVFKLSVWWAAYACRRGPLVSASDLGKIEQALSETKFDRAKVDAMTGSVAVAVAQSSNLIDGSLSELAASIDEGEMTEEKLREGLERIDSGLGDLATSIESARTELKSLLDT